MNRLHLSTFLNRRRPCSSIKYVEGSKETKEKVVDAIRLYREFGPTDRCDGVTVCTRLDPNAVCILFRSFSLRHI
jgi:hypothetical protein